MNNIKPDIKLKSHFEEILEELDYFHDRAEDMMKTSNPAERKVKK